MITRLTPLFMAAMLLNACAAEPTPMSTVAPTPPTPTTTHPPTTAVTLAPPPTATPRPTIRPTPSAAPEREQVIIRVPRPTTLPRKTVPSQQPPDDAEAILRRAITGPELLRLALRQPFLSPRTRPTPA